MRLYNSSGLSLDVITENIGQLANSKPDKISGDVKLKANIELLRLYGAYPSTKHSSVVNNSLILCNIPVE